MEYIVMQGVAENAQTLSDLVGSGKQSDVVSDLFAYMNLLNIQGMGLVEATERSSQVGHIIGKPLLCFDTPVQGLLALSQKPPNACVLGEQLVK